MMGSIPEPTAEHLNRHTKPFMMNAKERITSNKDIMKLKGPKEKKEPLRKEGKQKGVTTQKMMSFRVDNDLVEWLDSQPNKGRLINQLLLNEKSKQEGMR